MMDEQLRHKVVKGAQWAFFSSVSIRVLQIATTATLAKLLTPAEFGVFTLATIVTNAMVILPDQGFAQALVYLNGDMRRTANTALSLTAITSIALAAALFFGAPFVGTLFSTSKIVMPMRVMALALLLISMTTVPTALLDKELLFKRRAFAELSGWVVYSGISVTLAALKYGVWSMVIGWTAMSAVTMIVTWLVSPWRPRPEFRKDESRVVFNYGKHLVIGVLAAFAFLQIDKAAVGKWLGVSAVGFYGIAFTVCSLPATNLTSVVNRVMFPAFSKLQGDMEGVGEVYLRTIKHLAVAAFFAAGAMLVLPGPLIRVFYGPKWEPAIPLFSILAFYGLVRTIGATADSVFMGTGHPVYVKHMRMIQLGIGAGLMYPAAMRYGAEGVALLFTCASAAGAIYGLSKVQKILGIKTVGWLQATGRPAVASAVAGLMTWSAAGMFPEPSWTKVAVISSMLVVSYAAGIFLLDRKTYGELRTILMKPRQAGAL